MELYEMLREIQDADFSLEVTFPEWFSRQAWNGLLRRLDNIRDCCRGLHELLPQMETRMNDFNQTIISDAIGQIIDRIVNYINTEVVVHLEEHERLLNELQGFVRRDLIEQLREILQGLKDVKIDESVFVGVEQKIKSLRDLMQKYGKSITYIKNLIDKGKIGEIGKENQDLLNKIIENKEKFEPEVMEAFDRLIEIKEQDRSNIARIIELLSAYNDIIHHYIRQEKNVDKIIEGIANIASKIQELSEREPTAGETRYVTYRQTLPEMDIVNKEEFDLGIDMVTAELDKVIENINREVYESRKDLDRRLDEMLTADMFLLYRNEWREKFKDWDKFDSRLWSVESGLTDMWLQFNEFNKERRWQKAVKDVVGAKFEELSNAFQKLMVDTFEAEFEELWDILETVQRVQQEQVEEEELTPKEYRAKYGGVGPIGASEMYRAMEWEEARLLYEHEKEERRRDRNDINIKLTKIDETTGRVEQIGEDTLDALDDIDPRGDEAKRTLDGDREKATKRRNQPL